MKYTFEVINCVEETIAVALAMKRQGFPVRISEYPTEEPGVNHSQTQAKIKGEWQWMTMHHNDCLPRIWTKHFDAPEEETTYKPLKQFCLEQLEVRGE